MRESFSIPPEESRKHASDQIKEGITEYLQSPRSKEGRHFELSEQFKIERSEKPLRRNDIDKAVADFVSLHPERLLPLLLAAGDYPYGEELQKLNITNEDLGLFGVNYYIHKDESDNSTIYYTDEDYPEGHSAYHVKVSDLLALAWAKDNIRIDTQCEVNAIAQSNPPHRYYLKPQERYLCTNDYGMRVWNEEERRMVDGDITNATTFINTIKGQFDRIQKNLESLQAIKQKEITEELLRDAGYKPNTSLSWEVMGPIQELAQNRSVEIVQELFVSSPQDRELILTAVPEQKVVHQLHFNYQKIAQRYGLLTKDPVEDYERFNEGFHRQLERLFRKPSREEREGITLDFAWSDLYQKPFLTGKNGDVETKLQAQARDGIRSILANRAARADENIAAIFDFRRSTRGENSPYYYGDDKLYDFIREIGVEKAAQVLDTDERQVAEQVTTAPYLYHMGFDLSRMEAAELKKQLRAVSNLYNSGVLSYLENREKLQGKSTDNSQVESTGFDLNWWAETDTSTARSLFREGKRIYWLAQKIYMSDPNRREEERFYHAHQYTQWDRYDASDANISESQVTMALEKHGPFIIALLGKNKAHNDYTQEESLKDGPQATLSLILQALQHGHDLRGVGLAWDKQRYLQAAIKGEVENDLEFATSDWPEAWSGAVLPEELALYYDHADEYLLADPSGITKYAAWRASEIGQGFQDLFKDAPERKSDLDFRICIANQTAEVQSWYKNAAEYLGDRVIRDYILRFNTTRDSRGRSASLHDVLYWVPSLRHLEPGEARSVLTSIESMDENQEFIRLLPRYDASIDQFKNSGPIQSFRELKKRVFAIESNIDLSSFPPEVVDITTAPGFNLAALVRISQTDRFKALVEGELDKNQPFTPHERTFAGRSLTEALREGLGSQRQKIKGTAVDPKGLFFALNQLIKNRRLGERNMQVLDLLETVPVELEQDVIRLLKEQRVNIGPTVVAEVHSKSDPQGWVCGNYTDCCMSFGESNNTDYMFNPSTQYFTIKYNGRIVAQSVVVDGQDIREKSDVVILDNIEVANNYKHLTPLFAKVYQTFWTEYTSKPVKVGTGYSDLTPPGAKFERNTYRSKTVLEYSDAQGEQIYDMPKIKGIESLDEMTTFANMTERDAELIAKMEAEAYPEGMVQGKVHILDILKRQRELEVPGAASSFMVRQGQEPAGYLLILPEESEAYPDERVAHIHDMVVLPKFRGSTIARQMMERVLDTALAYGVSIEAEARASTSYPLLMNRRVRKWFEEKGFQLTRNEKLPEYLGGEDFYFVRFENQRPIED